MNMHKYKHSNVRCVLLHCLTVVLTGHYTQPFYSASVPFIQTFYLTKVTENSPLIPY